MSFCGRQEPKDPFGLDVVIHAQGRNNVLTSILTLLLLQSSADLAISQFAIIFVFITGQVITVQVFSESTLILNARLDFSTEQ